MAKHCRLIEDKKRSTTAHLSLSNYRELKMPAHIHAWHRISKNKQHGEMWKFKCWVWTIRIATKIQKMYLKMENKKLISNFYIPVPPKIMPIQSMTNMLKEGMRAAISCQILEGDLPVNFRFERNGKPLIGTRLFSFFFSTIFCCVGFVWLYWIFPIYQCNVHVTVMKWYVESTNIRRCWS